MQPDFKRASDSPQPSANEDRYELTALDDVDEENEDDSVVDDNSVRTHAESNPTITVSPSIHIHLPSSTYYPMQAQQAAARLLPRADPCCRGLARYASTALALALLSLMATGFIIGFLLSARQ
jgi:hypothetical protein